MPIAQIHWLFTLCPFAVLFYTCVLYIKCTSCMYFCYYSTLYYFFLNHLRVNWRQGVLYFQPLSCMSSKNEDILIRNCGVTVRIRNSNCDETLWPIPAHMQILASGPKTSFTAAPRPSRIQCGIRSLVVSCHASAVSFNLTLTFWRSLGCSVDVPQSGWPAWGPLMTGLRGDIFLPGTEVLLHPQCVPSHSRFAPFSVTLTLVTWGRCLLGFSTTKLLIFPS